MAFTPTLYAAAVAYVAPSNLITLLDAIPPYWEAGRKQMYTRMGDPTTPQGKALLVSESPLTQAKAIVTPLLVVQGKNDPRVNVEVTTYRPFYVVGEVQKPGEYPYANGMSASSAVALAGGFSPKAVHSVVYVRHQGENGEQRVAADEATPIRPGDVVRVDSTTFWDVMDILSPLAGVSALRYTIP